MVEFRLRIFGERNTGTRAVAQMLRPLPQISAALPAEMRQRATPPDPDLAAQIARRLKGRWRRLFMDALRDEARPGGNDAAAWKHAAPQFDASFARAGIGGVLFAVRNPYSWAVSLARRPYHMAGLRFGSIEDFLDTPWLTQRRDRTAPVLPSPMSLWSAKLAAYDLFTAQADIPCAWLRFEDFIDDPAGALGHALAVLGQGQLAGGLVPIDRSTKTGAPLTDLQDWYRAEGWRARLSARSVALVNAHTDWQIAAAQGYGRLNPEDFPAELPEQTRAQIAFEMKSAALDQREGSQPSD